MKVWGLEKIHDTRNTIITKSLEVFLLAVWLLSVHALFPVKPDQLLELVTSQFDSTMPGVESLLRKIHMEGFAFEAETALLVAEEGEKIIGFDLDINFRYQHGLVCIEGAFFDLDTTEFDIITDKHAIECKSGHSMKKACNVTQFIKEQQMIAWCKELTEQLAKGEIETNVKFSLKKTPYVVINGPATWFKDIEITSSWFTSNDPETCIAEFKEIAALLATKEACVYFKHQLTSALANKLTNSHIKFSDDTHLIAQMSQLNLSEYEQQERTNFAITEDAKNSPYLPTPVVSA